MVKIYAPAGEVGPEPVGLASSPPVLAGKRIGILDNTKPNAGVLLDRMAARLAERTGAEVTLVERKNAALAAPDDVIERCRDYAAQAYDAVGARGLARVDFFYLPDSDEVLVNEINTIPGLTPQSMFPPVWEAQGVAFRVLIDRLLAYAMEASEESARYSP